NKNVQKWLPNTEINALNERSDQMQKVLKALMKAADNKKE
ncbi:MAG: Unknown protein, partial [uncultured Aureispira sp.]